MPVISLSDQKDIALEVTVTNLSGDDAHEAKVNASFPSSLTYSAYRSPTEVSFSLTLTIRYQFVDLIVYSDCLLLFLLFILGGNLQCQ